MTLLAEFDGIAHSVFKYSIIARLSSALSVVPHRWEKLFKEGIQPLVDAGRQGALLIQFPWSFKNEPENRNYLWQLQNRFADYPLVLEVRHSSWIEPQVLETLAELAVGLCNIDQPLFHRSVKPAAH